MSAAVLDAAPAPAPPAPRAERVAMERLRLALVSLALALAVFAQSAGNAAADTKIDLVVSPLRFLGRAVRLWDPIGNAGQLQNQAYGYLFPMGPFFAGLHAIGVAPWEIQRAWEAALVVAAFLGCYLVARRLGVDSFWPAVGAGLVYALAPRTLGELTSISSELMPVAALPWVLLPLIAAATTGSPRRAAARSGVALLFAGGVNAAATLAVLPLPALWLLTRSRGRRKRALMGWWLLAVVLSCGWWMIPLLQLGRYSPPFLNWIESSSTTTLPTSLLATLRGVDHWEAYLGPSIWPAGWILASGRVAIVATATVAATGLVGISRRDVAHRLFLWSSLILGLLLVTVGHSASVGPPAAESARTLLDGALTPFRNVHKFDPLVRLPLALGVGFVLSRVRVPAEVHLGRGTARTRLPARVLAVLAVVGVGLVAVAPVLTNHVVASQRVTTDPSWWSSAGKWLAAHSGGARALVVPGSASPAYLWGATVDNALQPVATTPWTVRDSVPLAQAGYIRLLDSIEGILADGAANPELAPLLARAGIGYVVIANDLNTLASASTPLLYARTTLDNSPGLTLRASIGPNVGGTLSTTVLLDSGATVPRPAVQIYGVDNWDGAVALAPLTGAVEATGSSDALPGLLDRGLSPGTPVLFGADSSGVPVPRPVVVTTDGIRRQEASFAGLLNASVTMTATQPFSVQRPVHDYLPEHPGPLSSLRYTGIADVTASSSGADRLAYINRGDLNGPWSALDDDPVTAWQSSSFAGAVGQWLQVDFASPLSASTVALSFAATTSALPTSLAVRTDAGTVLAAVQPQTATQTIRLPAGTTRSLRLTVAAVADETQGGSVAISSLTIPGVSPQRSLQVASASSPDLLAFDVATGYRATCLGVAGTAICDPHYGRSGQEDRALDRRFVLGAQAATPYVPTATVRLVGGRRLDALLDSGAAVQVEASSTNSADPRQRPGAAVDGDLTTSWQAAPGEAKPRLTLHLPSRRTVAGVTLLSPVSAPTARPLRVSVSAGAQRWSGALPADGHIPFASPARTDTIVIEVDQAQLRATTDTTGLATRLLPVGIAEVQVDGVAEIRARTTDITIGCAAGLTLQVDGIAVALQVIANRADVLAGAPVEATPCALGAVRLGSGEHRVSLTATADAQPVSVTLAREGSALVAQPTAGTMTVRDWGATQRRVDVDTTSAGLLVVHENENAGWHASLHGKRLQPVRVDGWQQGFVVPAGAHGTVALTFTPQRPFVVGLVAGALGALAVVALAFVRGRRVKDPALGDGQPRAALLAGIFVLAIALLGGGFAVLTFAVLTVCVVLLGRTVYPVLSWVSGLLLVVAGVVVARAGSTLIFVQQNSALTQLLCIGALTLGALTSFSLPRHGREP